MKQWCLYKAPNHFFQFGSQERINRTMLWLRIPSLSVCPISLVFILRRTKIHFRASAIELRASNFYSPASFDPDLLRIWGGLLLIQSVPLNVTSRVKTVAIFWTTFYHRTNYHFLVLETRDAPESLRDVVCLSFERCGSRVSRPDWMDLALMLC